MNERTKSRELYEKTEMLEKELRESKERIETLGNGLQRSESLSDEHQRENEKLPSSGFWFRVWFEI